MRLSIAMILSLIAPVAFADPIVGVWKTDPTEMGTAGLVEVSACGAGFCAVIKGAADGSGDPAQAHLLGKQVFWGMLPVGDGRYEGGRLWSPKRDKEFNARLTLTGQTLVVEGCVMTICQVGGRWQRVN